MRSTRTARIARFYYNGELQCHSELVLPKSVSHHLMTVLRTRKGDTVELFNGTGKNFRATVIDTGQRSPGKTALLHIHEASTDQDQSPIDITLIQAISRGDRMDASLRQATELGINHIQPVYSRHSAKPLDEKRSLKKYEHWHSILVSASEQSGRTVIPRLDSPLSLTDSLKAQTASSHSNTVTYVLDPTASISLVSHLQTLKIPSTALAATRPDTNDAGFLHVTLVIGPESGLDFDEIEQTVSTGAYAVTIGPRILRTETAGPACIALVQATLGDLG